MATVQLADIYDPIIWAQAIQERTLEKNAFIQSGVMVLDPVVNAMASQPGTIGELPFYKGLVNSTEPNYSSDVVATKSTPLNISSGKQVFRKAFMNQSWSAMDLSVEVASADPVIAITNRIGDYWASANQRRTIASFEGVMADNLANDAGDMVYTAGVTGTADAGAVVAADMISAEAIINTWATMGDRLDSLVAIGMHSVCYNRLQVLNLIDYIPNSQGVVNMPTYMGKEVIVDDGMTAVADGTRTMYTTVLFGEGAVAGGVGSPTNPTALARDETAGSGGGEESIFSRTTSIIAPVGFQFLSAAIAGQSATEAELTDATEWDRAYEHRKNVNVAFLRTNG